MNTAPIYAGLKPTWRLLWVELRTFHNQDANRRAEKLVLRFMERCWSTAQIEQLLGLLIERDRAPRDERHRNSLARANGWGLAGQCPADLDAKTPAASELVSNVVAAARQGSVLPTGESAQRPGGAVV